VAKKKKKKLSSTSQGKKSEGKKVHPEITKGIWAIIMASLSILSVLSFFGKAGSFGSLIKGVLIFVSGWGMYIAPVLFLVVSVLLIFSWERNTNKAIVFSTLLFFSSILGIFALTSSTREEAIIRGGYWGHLFSLPLNGFLGTVGAYVVLFALVVISIILGFHLKMGEILFNIRENRKLKKGALEIKVGGEKIKEKIEKVEKIDNEGGAVAIKDYQDVQKDERAKVNKDKESKKDFFVASLQDTRFKDFKLPTLALLEQETGKPTSGDIIANANIIKRTLQNFGMDVEMGEVNVGPTVTQYTLKPAEGVKLSRITALNNDLSLALAAHPIRIEAPIPGKSFVGIEIPNKLSSQVRLGSLLDNSEFMENRGNLVLALGRDVKGSPVYADLSRMPHMLVAGATGSGKTIALNALILSLLFRNPPQLLRFILIDPKRVEFPVYSGIPHLLAPIIVDNNKAVNALKWSVGEMERRFEVLSQARVRDIHGYNSDKKVIKNSEQLPFIIIIIDELADLMSSKGREVEALIIRVAQMARAVGIHLVLATQRPSVEIITGLIKANITARMAFQVGSHVDSRTILDMGGAEKLLGSGDMLFLSPEKSKPFRVQGAYISEKEVKRVAEHLRSQNTAIEGEKLEDLNSKKTTETIDFDNMEIDADDELLQEAKDLIIKQGKASASYLQRRLRIGYARAARLLDILEDAGIVGPADGAKPRDVYVSHDEDNEDEYGDIPLV